MKKLYFCNILFVSYALAKKNPDMSKEIVILSYFYIFLIFLLQKSKSIVIKIYGVRGF